jgi:methionyl-tRNA formyltransferase
MKPTEKSWVVLFGGANRENVIFKLVEMSVDLKVIFVPKIQDTKLEKSIYKLNILNVKIIQVSRSDINENLKEFEGCALLSVGFPYLLSGEIIKRYSTRLNMHPTLLPQYRGPTTGPYILINNEKESGSTVHLLEEKMDSGDIVAQSRVSISKFDTVRSLQRKVYETEPCLIKKALINLDSGADLIKQVEEKQSTYPKKRQPKDSEIDSSVALLDLFDQIRACDPDNYPAFFMLNGEKVCIRLYRQEKDATQIDMI